MALKSLYLPRSENRSRLTVGINLAYTDKVIM